MANLIQHGVVAHNEWKTLRIAANENPASAKLPYGNVLVPLAVWQARKDDLIQRQWDQGHLLGAWLGPQDDPAALGDDLEDLNVVAVYFPTASDGRGFSLAALLRTRYGYRREIRAIGAVERDYLHALGRVGFDTFEIEHPEAALASLKPFSHAYQPAALAQAA